MVHRLHRATTVLGSLSPSEIEELLRTEVVVRLGCHSRGRTYVVPVTYVYENDALIIQSAEGLKVRMMRENPWVCVEVDHIDDLGNWQSVIAVGKFEPLTGSDAEAAFGRLRLRLQSVEVSETTTAAGTLREGETVGRSGNGSTQIYRIRLFQKTGRFERH